jgi:hypothetical protein
MIDFQCLRASLASVTAEGENEGPEWSVRRWVSASFIPCHSVEVFLDEFGDSFGGRVVLLGRQGSVAVLGVRVCKAAETSKSVNLRGGENGMTEIHFLPSREDASMTALAPCGSKDSSMDSLVAWMAGLHRYRCARTVWLTVSMS